LRGRIEVVADHRQIERMVRMQRLPSAVIVGDCRPGFRFAASVE